MTLPNLDWEDRERVLRLMFSKMNSGGAPSNWRQVEAPTSGAPTSGREELNQSFRVSGGGGQEEEEEDYDQEIDEDNEEEEEEER